MHRATAAARHVLDQSYGRGAVPIQSSSEDVREKPTIPGQNTTQRDRKGGKFSRDNSYVYPFDFLQFLPSLMIYISNSRKMEHLITT